MTLELQPSAARGRLARERRSAEAYRTRARGANHIGKPPGVRTAGYVLIPAGLPYRPTGRAGWKRARRTLRRAADLDGGRPGRRRFRIALVAGALVVRRAQRVRESRDLAEITGLRAFDRRLRQVIAQHVGGVSPQHVRAPLGRRHRLGCDALAIASQ